MAESVNTGGLKKFVYHNSKKIEIKLMPKEKNISVQIKIKSVFGKPKKGIGIELRRIDKDFYDKTISKIGRRNTNKKNLHRNITDEGGVVKFNILKGLYFAKFYKKSGYFEKIIGIENTEIIPIKTPIFFGIIKKALNKEEVMDTFEKIREDKKYCSKCCGEYSGIFDRFKCSYCGKYYCGNHHLPEDHKCKGLKK